MKAHVREALQKEDYDFLKQVPVLGDRILYLVVSGSYGYGTDYAGSDIDLRGCALEGPEVLWGLESFEQYEDEATDTVIYGLKKFVRLAMGANPNILELLGVPEDCIYQMTPAGKLLLEHADLFLSQRVIGTFGGYAMAQLRRLQNALAQGEVDEHLKQKHMADTLKRQIQQFNQDYASFEGGHLEVYADATSRSLKMNVQLQDYPIKDFVGMYANITNTLKNYEKLNHRNNKKETEKLYKHAMHLVRILITGKGILEGKGIQTRLHTELPTLLDIRHGAYSWEKVFEIVDYYEKAFHAATQMSKLPEYPDEKKVNELLYKIYGV